MIDIAKKCIRNATYKLNEFKSSKHLNIKVDYENKLNNFGDVLNPYLCKFIFEDRIDVIRIDSKYFNNSYYMAIGSILQRANTNATIWGSGFISRDSILKSNPKKILAVRGKKTYERLVELGIKDLPNVFGDPALLLPKFYKPNIKKKYKVGLMPHYVDKMNSWVLKEKEKECVLFIDVQNPNPLNVVNQMLSCEVILSSSLHGLIVSDAYNIPNTWIRFSNLIGGGDFKYHDYFSTTSFKKSVPFIIDIDTDIKKVIKDAEVRKLETNLEILLEVIINDVNEFDR